MNCFLFNPNFQIPGIARAHYYHKAQRHTNLDPQILSKAAIDLRVCTSNIFLLLLDSVLCEIACFAERGSSQGQGWAGLAFLCSAPPRLFFFFAS